MSTHFHPLRVREVVPDTAEAMIVVFDVPEALQSAFAFTQGQYLTLRRFFGDQELRRSYSICAGVDDGELRVGVRKVRDGVFSNWIHAELRPGDTLDVMPPQGRFHVPLDARLRRHHLGIAGGSGVTPILSTLKTVLAREPLSRFTLIYGNRTLASTMFKEELEDLKNRYLSRLVLHHVFSDEPAEAPLNEGTLDRDKIRAFVTQLVPAEGIDHAYLCGPFQMNDEAEAALLSVGVPAERIHVERFGVPRQAGGAVLHETLPGDAEQSRVTLIRDGRQQEFAFRKGQASILDAATSAGLDLPFSCTSGVCGTCRARLIDGEVRMDRNFALDATDLANRFILCCQAHPLTAQVRLSFDER